MSSKTDKFISKKLHDIISRGATDSIQFEELRSVRLADRVSIYALFGGSILIGIFLMVAFAVANMGKLWFFGAMGASLFAWFSFYQKVVKIRRLYRLIDSYRVALIEKEIRSIKDICKVVDSNAKEFVDELKELQDKGLFQQFSIDRTKMMLIEDADWGIDGSGEFEKRHFVCGSCGAQNHIYSKKGANSLKCEYCESVTTAQ